MQVDAFIMQNWCIYTIWRCAPCWMDMGKDEFHSYTEEGFFLYPMQRQVLGWCLVWHDQRTGIDMHKNGFWWAHMREGAELQRTLWLSGCVPVCIPPCTPIEEPNGSQAESSEQYRPVSQIWTPSGGLSRTSGKLWQDYSNCYMFWT